MKSNVKKPTTAPPVAQRQRLPFVLQTKMAPVKATAPSKTKPVGPTIYRPQPIPKVLQTKMNTANGGPAASRPNVPSPAPYRPQAVPRVLQRKAQISAPSSTQKPNSATNNMRNTVQRARQAAPTKSAIQLSKEPFASPQKKYGTFQTNDEIRRDVLTQTSHALHDMSTYQERLLYPQPSPLLSGVGRLASEKHFHAQVFQLDEYEKRALEAYGNANKGESELEGRRNVHYMFESKSWGPYESGWNALRSALRKLPTLGSLGLSIPTYRVERPESELMKFLRGRNTPVYIIHGVTKDKEGGQLHFMSASIMPSSHSNVPDKYNRGLLKIIGSSACYMNSYSIQGLVDGGEVLFPPLTVTLYDGTPRKQQWMNEEVDVFVLREVAKGSLDPRIPMVEDYMIKDVTDRAISKGYYQS